MRKEDINFLLLAIIFFLIFHSFFNISHITSAIITMLTAFIFMLIHGCIAWGIRNILMYLLITWICSFCSEVIGVSTGYVFGPYYYSDQLGPKLFGVPLMIQVSYAAMGYACLITARLILGVYSTPHRLSLFFSALVGTLLMVGWDLCMDPYGSTIEGAWIWLQSGPYFGVGIHNYVGWFLTVFMFMFLYQVFASRFPEKMQDNNLIFWTQPLIYYALMALNIILVPWVGGVDGPIASPENYSGTLHDLIYSMSLITFFVMGTPFFIAMANLLITRKSSIMKSNQLILDA